LKKKGDWINKKACKGRENEKNPITGIEKVGKKRFIFGRRRGG